jgi:TolB-like protein
MLKWCLLFFSVIFLSDARLHAQQTEFASIADGLAQDVAAAGKKSIAVVDFTDLQGKPTELGRFLAEEFSVQLARTHKGLEVVDRTHLKAILEENKLSSSGLIDPTTAKKLGQMVGADVLLTGTMTPFSESVRVNVKVLATDTAKIVAANNVDLPRTKTIGELLGPGEIVIAEGSGTPLRPRGRSDSTTSEVFQSSSPVVVSQQFVYEVLQCKGLSSSVTCFFRVTNRGPDRVVVHNCYETYIKAFDNFGNESDGEYCSLANKRSPQPSGLAIAQLISGVSVQASITFQRISASASSLSLINLRLGWGPPPDPASFEDFYIAFRNVPIIR